MAAYLFEGDFGQVQLPTLLEILGPVSIVVAALGGAWFAARYARDNTRQELAAAELRIDRQATRTTIDEVVGTMTEALDSAADFAVAVEKAERLQREIDESPADSPEYTEAKERYADFVHGDLEPTRIESFNAFLRLHPARLRLRLRFATDDTILVAFGKWQSAMEVSRDRVRQGTGGVRSESQRQEVKEAGAQIPVALEEFVSAVRTWIVRADIR